METTVALAMALSIAGLVVVGSISNWGEFEKQITRASRSTQSKFGTRKMYGKLKAGGVILIT